MQSIEEAILEASNLTASASYPAGHEFPNLHALLDTLPADRRAEVYQIAAAVGLKPSDDLLYSLLVGLGYHKTVLANLPDQMRAAGEGAAKSVARAGNEAATTLVMATSTAKAEFTNALTEASAGFQLAAQKGVQVGIESANLDRVFQQVKTSAEAVGAKNWFGKALVVASVAMLVALITGACLGWFVKSSLAQPATQEQRMALLYFSQLSCGAVQANGQFSCSDKTGGRIQFRGLRVDDLK